jgi:cytochrome c peroxidase
MSTPTYVCSPVLVVVALAIAIPHAHSQQTSVSEREGKRLFTAETFGGNGRTCATCHSLDTGTVSPQDAQERLRKNFRDPLFLFDGSDDGQGNGFSRMLADATILVKIPLPPNVRLADDPARFVILRRGIPSTHNTPALDPVLMLDGREPDLVTQARHAIENHAQNTKPLADSDLRLIADFQLTDDFFSSPALAKLAPGTLEETLPQGSTDSEKRGRRFFVSSPIEGDGKKGACAACHSGPMLNQTDKFLPVPVPPGTRFISVMSEFNAARNPLRQFLFTIDGSEIPVMSPDPGRALVTGLVVLPPLVGPPPAGVFTNLNAFKIPSLWGVRKRAPYFHDNSAKTLEDVAAHYTRFFLSLPVPEEVKIRLTKQDEADIVAFLKLLN